MRRSGRSTAKNWRSGFECPHDTESAANPPDPYPAGFAGEAWNGKRLCQANNCRERAAKDIHLTGKRPVSWGKNAFGLLRLPCINPISRTQVRDIDIGGGISGATVIALECAAPRDAHKTDGTPSGRLPTAKKLPDSCPGVFLVLIRPLW